MAQFEVPAVVTADPQANVTDLLVERVKATPSLALFAVPDGAGWRDVTAAAFLREFVRPDITWAHLDIAGPAWNDGAAYDFVPKGGTGAAVRTLIALARSFKA